MSLPSSASPAPPPAPKPREGYYSKSSILPQTTPTEAYEFFLNYIWKSGGDLSSFSPTPNLLNEGHPVTGLGCERVLPPLNTREEILETSSHPGKIVYRVVNPGWTKGYPVVKDSHRGEVTFDAFTQSDDDDGSSLMVSTKVEWKVSWKALRGGEGVVRFLTSSVVGRLMRNLVNYAEKKKEVVEKCVVEER